MPALPKCHHAEERAEVAQHADQLRGGGDGAGDERGDAERREQNNDPDHRDEGGEGRLEEVDDELHVRRAIEHRAEE